MDRALFFFLIDQSTIPSIPFIRADAERKKEKKQQLEEWAAGCFLLCCCLF